MEARYYADDSSTWTYGVAPANTKVTLLNIGKVQSTGVWTGTYGEAFIAWAPLIKRDKTIETVLEFFQFRYTWAQVLALPSISQRLPPELQALCTKER